MGTVNGLFLPVHHSAVLRGPLPPRGLHPQRRNFASQSLRGRRRLAITGSGYVFLRVRDKALASDDPVVLKHLANINEGLHIKVCVCTDVATIPGIGPIIATAIPATVADPSTFCSGREFAAWLGLVPRQNSTGGKARLGGISKRGDSYLRRLLVNSALTVLLCSKQAKTDPWLTSLLSRKPRLVVAVALANKTARVAWAIMSRQDTYRHAPLAA